MGVQAVAVVTLGPDGKPVPGVVGKLGTTDGAELLLTIGNDDGYDKFDRVPVPFVGTIRLQARTADGKMYVQPIAIPDQPEVTIRVGGAAVGPHDIVLPACLPFKSGSVLPAVPTRAQVCGLRTSLQGLTYETAEYGPFPAWFYAMLTPADRAGARAVHRAAGDKHITIPIAEAYKEPGTLWPEALKSGYDYTQNLDALRAVVTETVCAGLFIDMPLAGDGIGDGPGYNDPVGNTYGYGWLLANLPQIVAGLKGDGTAARPDLTPYILFRPGWDGVFYGWGIPGEVPDRQPERVRTFGELFRSLLPAGYLAIEHTPGNIPCGEGGGDFAPGGLMRNYDTILSEFNTVHEDSCWQVVARMVPNYTRPPDQPAGDDPNPPFYLAPGNERGPYFYVGFEPTQGGVYEWCRGRCTLADVEAVRAYLRALGCAYTG